MNASKTPHWISRFPFFYGWIILGVSILCGFISGPGQTYGVSIFVDPMIKDLGFSRTVMAILYTVGSLSAAALMIIIGRLLDRYGARILLATVTILFGFALIWMSSVDSSSDLYLGFLAIRTLGQGSLTLIPTTLLAIWFIKGRGRVMPFFFLGSALSQAAFPPLIHKLVTTFGWRDSWDILGLIVWASLLIPVILLIRRTPESVGLSPDGGITNTSQIKDLDQKLIFHETNWTLPEAIKTRSFWLLLYAGAPLPLISTALVFNHISLMDSRGFSAGIAASTLSIMAPSSLVGSFGAGYFLDKFANRYTLAMGQIILVLAMICPMFIQSSGGAFFYGGLLGLAGGCVMTVNSVIWPNYYGRASLGTIRGIGTTSSVAFAALGPLPFAYLFELTNTYTVALVIFLVLPITAILAALFALPPNKRKEAT